MKEVRFFYTPNIKEHQVDDNCELPEDEAKHAVRVLRLGIQDEINLMDGEGIFYRAIISATTSNRCLFHIKEKVVQPPAWKGHLHIAMAPTKLNDRTEWFVEKATEIGIDEFSFLNCQFSERRVLKTERVEKIVISAMKQSHKPWKPTVNEMITFRQFVETPRAGQKFICHCYDENDICSASVKNHVGAQFQEGGVICNEKPHIKSLLSTTEDCTVLIGPEGDFSIEEVCLAEANGFQSVSLGTSRLRTETAALVTTHIMQLYHQL